MVCCTTMPYRCLAPLLVLASTLAAVPARAATVTALPLPEGYTVKPEGESRLISMAADHTVAAVASTEPSGRSRAVRWDARGTRATFVPLPVLTAPGHGQYSKYDTKGIGGIAAGRGVVYVAATEMFSGAYSGLSFEAQRWIGSGTRRWTLPSCAAVDETDQHVNAVDADGRLALTMDMTGLGSHTVMQDEHGEYAPYAFIIDHTTCHDLGRAVVVGLRGRWAAGYRGYLNGHVAPTSLNVIVQRAVAVRWHDFVLSELGDGEAYAVNASGLAVGASAVAGRFDWQYTNFYGNPGREYRSAVPHARAWDPRGRTIAIETSAIRSVAYDVKDDGTVVGMLQAGDKRHFAFRWRAGRLERLDDLPHPAGWRFESAYAIAADGTIAGIGTHNGIATVFTWHE